PNVHPVGRNGMHKYNNQDHSMYTAMLTVENIHGAQHDIWAVNVEEEYHEEMDVRIGAEPVVAVQSSGRDAPILPWRPTSAGNPSS
ncbi:MAG: FAD-dependent oxidoreductase, partial [Acidimicrobiales bacterium]